MAEPVRISFLGGLGEIGRNCACIEASGQIVVIDCGLMFPDPDMLGVDLVLPDLSYLKENADRIAGLVLTHGHEDHTGALAFALEDLAFDVYGSPLTVALTKQRVSEAGLSSKAKWVTAQDGELRQIGPFEVEFIPVTHSVPQGFALAFHTPQGVILHSGDFKIDLEPVDGRFMDLERIGALANSGGSGCSCLIQPMLMKEVTQIAKLHCRAHSNACSLLTKVGGSLPPALLATSIVYSSLPMLL